MSVYSWSPKGRVIEFQPFLSRKDAEQEELTRRKVEHLKNLGLCFSNSAAAHCSYVTGAGYDEKHPPVCPLEMQAYSCMFEAQKKKPSKGFSIPAMTRLFSNCR